MDRFRRARSDTSYEMAVTIVCPHLKCRSILQVPDNVRGKKVRCGRCGKNFIVPKGESKDQKKPSTEPAPK